ncbi:hypothetical protein C3Y05_004560 [Aeromonas allosaccharophila]|uniref:hypothetical protein n=1 Tax=Aeromonas allosaccharophila TaxID=656 RepID=UPI0013C79FB2|nr:hypothetical protein [Aeromonas allosaccharophila]WDO02903.1 hypothetical protein C3Y05_004560 [Aeromonas allosaccharophila]
MKHQNDHIKFPSGNTVEFCRKKAKKLAKEKGIKLAQALDIIAELNGISGGWHNAMQQLNNKPQSSALNSTQFREALGKLAVENNRVGDVIANFDNLAKIGIGDYQITKFKTVLDTQPIPIIDAVKVGAAISKQLANFNNQHAGFLKHANVVSSVIGAQIRNLPEAPLMPAGFEELIKKTEALVPKLPDNLERTQRMIDATASLLPDNLERTQRMIDATASLLPDNLERTQRMIDALIPRELREYQKTLKQLEDVVNRPLSDLRK